jgi:hypothetical protein
LNRRNILKISNLVNVSQNFKRTPVKHWTYIGWIKTGILLLFLLSIFRRSIDGDSDLSLLVFARIVTALLIGLFLIPVIVKMFHRYGGSDLKKPEWNDNPFSRNLPLVFFHFAAFFMISVGVSLEVIGLIRDASFNFGALVPISYGTGVLLGISKLFKE